MNRTLFSFLRCNCILKSDFNVDNELKSMNRQKRYNKSTVSIVRLRRRMGCESDFVYCQKKSKENKKKIIFCSTSKNLQKSFSFFVADVTPYFKFYISCSFFCFEQTRVSCNEDSTLKKSFKIARFEVSRIGRFS